MPRMGRCLTRGRVGALRGPVDGTRRLPNSPAVDSLPAPSNAARPQLPACAQSRPRDGPGVSALGEY
eukprot:4483433-Prymnesium_polylepis.1